MTETGQEELPLKPLDPPLYDEDDWVAISALNQFLYCPRRCALIHIEQQWNENVFTAEGRVLHERVHTSGLESRRVLRVEYSVPVRSLRLGVTGQADIVEFHRQEDGTWLPLPVEYKRGRPKKDKTDQVQLCAQAMCLEEMLGCAVAEGAIYYGEKRRRFAVLFDPVLRQATVQAAAEVHALLAEGKTPAPRYAERCESCSFLPLCLPRVATCKQVDRYLRTMVAT